MNQRVIKNASWLIACRIVQAIMNLVISMISARYLGPSNFGIINYAASLVAFIVPLAQLGLRHILVQDIINQESKDGEILGTALVMSVLSSILGIVGILSFVSIVNRGETDTLIVCGLYSLSLIFQMTEMTQYWFQAKLMSRYTAIISLAAYAVVSGYKIFLLATGKSVYWFAVSNALDFLLISLGLYACYRKIGGGKLSFSVSRGRSMFNRGKYYIVSGMMVTIFAQTDRIMLKLMCGDAVTGYYSAAVACAGMTSFVFAAIIDSMRPMVLESKKNKDHSYQLGMICLFSVIFYLGLAQSIFLTVAAQPVVGILYGSEFAPAVSVLQIVTWYSAFSYMGSARNVWILAEEQQKHLWKINCSGAVLNVVGNYILIPIFGAEGAAAASVMTQFFTNFLLCFLIKPIRPCGKLILSGLNPRYILQMRPKRLKKEN